MVRDDIRHALQVVTGIGRVEFEPSDPVVLVDFDANRTGLAEIVRVIEDQNLMVASIARRSQEPLIPEFPAEPADAVSQPDPA